MRDTILEAASLHDFFSEAVATVLEHHGLAPREGTAAYLVNLLCEFMSRSMAELEQPLGVMMAQTQYSDPVERAAQLKRVGDDALYMSSFLREHLRRRQLDLNYYRDLGGTAYGRLSELLQRKRAVEPLSEVYTELSTTFGSWSDVLADVRLCHLSTQEPGALYETWLETRSKLVEAKLRQLGVQGDLAPTPLHVDASTHGGHRN